MVMRFDRDYLIIEYLTNTVIFVRFFRAPVERPEGVAYVLYGLAKQRLLAYGSESHQRKLPTQCLLQDSPSSAFGTQPLLVKLCSGVLLSSSAEGSEGSTKGREGVFRSHYER